MNGEESEDTEKMEQTKKILELALTSGNQDLTLVVEDPSGKSRINSSRARRSKLEG